MRHDRSGVGPAGLATVLIAAGLAAYLGLALHGASVAGYLARHRATPYAVGVWWVLVAPLVLLVAARLARRWPWPWVLACGVHLAVLVAVTTRLRHVVPDAVLGGVGVAVVVGVASVVATVAAARPSGPSGPRVGRRGAAPGRG